MIVDTLENLERYSSLNPLFPEVFEVIRKTDFLNTQPGHISFQGKEYYINVDVADLRPSSSAYPEAHDRFIDIQIPLSRSEFMGYMPRVDCSSIKSENKDKDISFFNDVTKSMIHVRPGMFAIFFPNDAHAPIIGEGTTKKIVVKVPVK